VIRTRLRRLAAAALILGALAPLPAAAVVILDSTWQEEGGSDDDPAAGFAAALDLAAEPQFDGVLALSTDGESWGEASATWLGNDDGHAYLLTAAHIFELPGSVDDYVARTPDGDTLAVDRMWIHPKWNGSADERTGYDIAILRLEAPIEGIAHKPILYTGHSEAGELITFVGYGNRGIGSVGEAERFLEGTDKAAAQGIVDIAEDAVKPFPEKGETGNYLTIALPKEDGSVELPTDGDPEPANRLVGLLGSGDSGGSAWMQVGRHWEIVGINSNGTGNATYGETSSFCRISMHRAWIAAIFAGARFGKDE
jgi:hypothetical protein